MNKRFIEARMVKSEKGEGLNSTLCVLLEMIVEAYQKNKITADKMAELTLYTSSLFETLNK